MNRLMAISRGRGVLSSAMALMAGEDVCDPAPDCIAFADTTGSLLACGE